MISVKQCLGFHVWIINACVMNIETVYFKKSL